MSTWKGSRTPEQRARAAALQRARRARLTPEQREAEAAKKRASDRRRKADLTPEQRAESRHGSTLRQREWRAALSESERAARRVLDTAQAQARRAAKTPGEREAELLRKRELESARRASWTPEQRASRWLRGSAVALGLDPDVIESHFMSHSGSCDICGRTAAEVGVKSDRLFIDHDHATGIFRGLLCHFCNLAIGQMEDQPERLIAAAEYLLKARWHAAAAIGAAQVAEEIARLDAEGGAS